MGSEPHAEATPPDGDAVFENLGENLLQATHIFVAIAANSLTGKTGELSIQQYRALALLASRGKQRPVDLARYLGVTPSTTTTLCDRLVAKGLLSRRGGADRRSISLSVTAQGLDQLEKIKARRREMLREIYRRMPPDVQTQFAQTLPSFIEAAGDLGIEEWSIRGLVAGQVSAADWVQ